MKVIKIYCKECENELTSELNEIPQSDLCWEENEETIAKNNFSILLNQHSNTKSIVVALDHYNLKNHSDDRRFQGCCGSDGSNGLNKLCLNGHEVATEISDCWTGRYIEFDISKIIIKEKTINDSYKELKL